VAPTNQLWLTLVVLDVEVITFVVPLNASTYLGRDPSSNDLVLHDAKVSRTHARLSARAGSFALQDLSSAGGTTVNDVPVAQEVTLRSGDIIGIGPYTLRADIRPWRHLDEDEAGDETIVRPTKA